MTTGANFSFWDFALLSWGDGSDGDVTISGALTLSRDMHYNNLTVSAGAAINTSGCRIYVKNTLDLSAAPSGSFYCPPVDGGDASGSTAGTGATSQSVGVNFGGSGGTNYNGATGTTGVGVAAARMRGKSAFGGHGGDSGKGGNGASGAGGAVTLAGTWHPYTRFRALTTVVHGPRLMVGVGTATVLGPGALGGLAGSSGASGAGDGSNTGGGGGGGASCAIPAFNNADGCFIAARHIERGTNSNTGIFSYTGGDGGNGGTPAAGNCGGGGGGGGASGGFVVIHTQFMSGSTIADAIDLSGGDGGNGGNGVGTGAAGDGAYGGGGGSATIFQSATGTRTYTAGTESVANTGQTGGTGVVQLIDL